MATRTVGLFFKEKEEVKKPALELYLQLKDEEYEVFLLKEQAGFIDQEEFGLPVEELARRVKLLLTLGGDGTLLRAGRTVGLHGIPLLGINIGKLGFLTEVELAEVFKALIQALKGEYFIDERMMIEAEVRRAGKKIDFTTALNDIVVAKAGIARIIKLRTYVNEEFMTTYSADGLIVSTPTGSTGHNLSAGGPILMPSLSAIIMTAICPLAINMRPVVLAAGEADKLTEIRIHVVGVPDGQEMLLTADGQYVVPLHPGDDIIIKKSLKHTVRFIRLKPFDFFAVLRRKLGWGKEE